MVVSEKTAQLMEARQGRNFFIRKVLIGSAWQNPSLTLVALHGTCATQSQYNLVLMALDEPLSNAGVSIVCWLYDNVGCGQSPVLDEWDAYSNEEFADDLRAILMNITFKDEYLDLPVVLMGHSYSPTIVLEMLNRGLPVDNLNLAGFVFVGSAIRAQSNALKMEDGGHPIMKLPVFILNCLQNMLSESFLQLALCKDCPADLRERCRQQNNANGMAMAKATHRHHKWATSEDLKSLLNIPVLVIHGTEDGILSPQCSEEIAKELPNASLILIEKASHLVMLEQPTKMANALSDFLIMDVLKRPAY